jgi:hypothetical protein
MKKTRLSCPIFHFFPSLFGRVYHKANLLPLFFLARRHSCGPSGRTWGSPFPRALSPATCRWAPMALPNLTAILILFFCWRATPASKSRRSEQRIPNYVDFESSLLTILASLLTLTTTGAIFFFSISGRIRSQAGPIEQWQSSGRFQI